jgi:Putative peptidoglycan binding domain
MSKHQIFFCLLLAGYFTSALPILADSPHGGGGRGAGSAQAGSRAGFRGGRNPGNYSYRGRGYGRNWNRGGYYRYHRWYAGYGGAGIYGFGYPFYSGSYYPYDYPFAYDGDTPYYGYSYYPESAGSSEAAVQAALAQRGYYNGPIDGILGPASYRAIRAFQAAHGLPPTGQVDSKLLRELRR